MTTLPVIGEVVYMAGGGVPAGVWMVMPDGGFHLLAQEPMTSPTALHGLSAGLERGIRRQAFGGIGATAAHSIGLLGHLLAALLIGVSVEVLAYELKRIG